jgi:hypothetical protein
MKPALRMVPWTGLPEWRYVAKCVSESIGESGLSEDGACIDEAVRWLTVWCIRGNAPPAIESTRNLLEIKQILGANRQLEYPRTVQLALAAAIVRFVNENVDPEQQGVYAQPVSFLASRMGIPRLLVDIRHAATHDELPSLELLQIGMELALEWLLANYWRPQNDFESGVRDAFQRIIDKYLTMVKESDPLQKTPEEVAGRTLNEMVHLETSGDIQKIFWQCLLESSLSLEQTMPVVSALMKRNEGVFVILADLLSSSVPEASERTLQIFNHATSRVTVESIIAKSSKCCLQKGTSHAWSLVKRMLENLSPGVVSNELMATVNQILTSKFDKVSGSPTLDLITQAESFLHNQSLKENCPTSSSSSHPKGWFIPSEWNPSPWGVTPLFDPVRDFRDLISSSSSSSSPPCQ